ncbi:MAG: EAL domain-containing protein [Bryobacteraceae bacterium]
MEPGKVLVVDEDLASRTQLSESLASSGYAVEVACAAREAIEKIREDHFDLVLLDPATSGESGADLLALLRGTFSREELPVILVTQASESSAAQRSLVHGANDYITKPVEFPLVTARIDAHLSQAQAERQAKSRDALTGLDNRPLFMKNLETALSSGTQTQAVTLVLLNLDGFKLLNASFGQRTGDQLLAQAANRLKRALRGMDVARIAGDEFAILQLADESEADPNSVLEEMAARAVACFQQPFSLGDTLTAMTASVGGALSAGCRTNADELWREADLAMRRAKAMGKNRCEFFDPAQREDVHARALIGRDLRHALDRHELTAFYQPKVDLRTCGVIGFEALLRWKHPVRGLVPPAEFIPAAEELGFIVPIGEWILMEACRQLKAWQHISACTGPLTMNVNLSVKQLHDPQLVSRVSAILQDTGIEASALKLELTESALMTEIESAKSTLTQLRALGVGLKLDDFGTGYSSLNYLRTLHFESLKIDRSFIAKIVRDPETKAIVATIINLAHILRMQVVAEGIETEEQLHLLQQMGCDIGQGYYFSKPLAADEAEQFLCRQSTPQDPDFSRPVARVETHQCRSVA